MNLWEHFYSYLFWSFSFIYSRFVQHLPIVTSGFFLTFFFCAVCLFNNFQYNHFDEFLCFWMAPFLVYELFILIKGSFIWAGWLNEKLNRMEKGKNFKLDFLLLMASIRSHSTILFAKFSILRLSMDLFEFSWNFWAMLLAVTILELQNKRESGKLSHTWLCKDLKVHLAHPFMYQKLFWQIF